jgi:hypothetical protein
LRVFELLTRKGQKRSHQTPKGRTKK